MAPLTEAQRAVLRYLEERSEDGQPPPTYRDICDRFGYRSPKAAADHVMALERKGYIVRDPKCARGIRLAKRRQRDLPLLGRIVAGRPAAAESPDDERLILNIWTVGVRDKSKAFALRVQGDSMMGRGIFHGDIVLLEHDVVPQHEDVVAALIDNESTLKTFVCGNGKAWLRAENPRYPNLIPAWELQIQGVARAVIHSLVK